MRVAGEVFCEGFDLRDVALSVPPMKTLTYEAESTRDQRYRTASRDRITRIFSEVGAKVPNDFADNFDGKGCERHVDGLGLCGRSVGGESKGEVGGKRERGRGKRGEGDETKG
jgi:hypothetical protein